MAKGPAPDPPRYDYSSSGIDGKIGTVIPSHKGKYGGSHGFSVTENPEIRIVDTSGGGMVEIGSIPAGASAGSGIPAIAAATNFEMPEGPGAGLESTLQMLVNALSQNQSVASASVDTVDPDPPVLNPDIKVFFSGAFGDVEAFYHDVMVNENLLVLVFETKCTTHMRYSPPRTGDRSMAVKITGADLDHSYPKVYSEGIHFELSKYGLHVYVLIVGGSDGEDG
jgi:hypothetical protein